MASLVQQPNLGPPTPKYPKDDPPPVLDDPSRSHQSHGLQYPRASSLAQQASHPKSPHQSSTGLPQTTTYAQPPLLNSGIPSQQQQQQQPQQQQTPPPQHSQPPQRQPSYGPAAQEPGYYTSHPGAYTLTSAPQQYPSSEAPDLMAATAQMQRPYPPIYQTPQPNSPTSLPSPQGHDQHGRGLYGQSPQLPPTMYSYPQYPPMNPIHSTPYAQHPATSQHPQITSQPLLVGPPGNPPQLPPQHPAHQPPPPPPQQPHPSAITSSPRMKLEGSGTPQQPTPPHKTPLSASHPPTSAPSTSDTHSGSSAGGTNTTAAPGPIPATTPLVVRQDNSGVQWIAFEYSRDRVKMEYTIRCDVESVVIENLSQEFKTENCVYPRACCTKDQYRGNRLVYETECNAVGWALAELNPCLRGKRGLIQRAVDSWRNSNQDPRLRSRRVRRMAKVNNRKASIATTQGNHLAGPPAGVAAAVPPGPPTTAGGGGLNPTSNLSMGPQQLHHHHAHPDASTNTTAPGHVPGDVSGNSEYTHDPQRPTNSYTPPGPPADLRAGNVFHGYPSYPPPSASSNVPPGPSMPPALRDGTIDNLMGKRNAAVATSASSNKGDDHDEVEPSSTTSTGTGTAAGTSTALFGDLPEGRRRKFILVDDPQRGCRVRVKAMLDQVDMSEIPDSYRKSNSVFPRTYFPVQGPFSAPHRSGTGQFADDVDDDGDVEMQNSDGEDGTDQPAVGRTVVPVPMLEGGGNLAVPKMTRGRRNKEMVLNDLGYRMSWGQSRVFAGRTLFLQRALDAYRNKMRSTMLTAGQETTSVAPHFETRVGKRKWLERTSRARSGSEVSVARPPLGSAPASAGTASSRDIEEVEG